MTAASETSPEALAGPAPRPAHREYPLWHYVWKLLRLRWTLWWSSLRRAKLGRKIGLGILALVILAVFGLIFAGSFFFLRFLRSPRLAAFVPDAPLLLESMPVLVVAGAFLGILLTSFGVLLQALYLAGDMDFLLSAPIPIRAVFITKLLQAILPNFSLIALFGLPVLYGLGIAGGYNLLYYPLVLVVLAALALAAAGISSLLVMGVARIFPARRVAEVLAFLGAIFSIVCSQSGNLINQVEDVRLPAGQLSQGLGIASRLSTPWSPLNWAGQALVDIGEGRWLTGLLFLALALGLSSAVFYLSLVTAERLYYTGWASMQGTPRRKRPARTQHPAAGAAFPLAALGKRLLPAPVRAIITKDLLVLRRDLRNMSQVVTPLIFGIIYGIMLLRGGGEAPAGRGEAPAAFMNILESAMAYGSVGISLFVGWSLISRLGLMGFSQEGKNYWLLKVAPVRSSQLLLAKFLVAFLPSLALGWIFLVLIALVQRSGIPILLFGLAVVALCMAGTAGINLAFGVKGANLDWEDPRHMSRGTTGCLSTLVTLGFLPFSLALFFGPPILLPLLEIPESVGRWLGLALGGTISLACAFLPLWLVRHDVDRIGEA
jgi:ABC-2 type transport system permease protein